MNIGQWQRFGITVALVAASAVGCGKVPEEDDSGLGSADLQGTWTMACTQSGASYEKRQLTFDDNGFAFSDVFYDDEACTTKSSAIAGSGSYVFDGSAINYDFVTYTWSFVDDPGLADEYGEACGATALSGVVNVKGKSCELDGDTTLNFYSPAYGSLTISGGRLFASTFLTNGATEETRSFELDWEGGGWEKEVELESASMH